MAGCYVGDGLNGWYWRSMVHATGCFCCCIVVLLCELPVLFFTPARCFSLWIFLPEIFSVLCIWPVAVSVCALCMCAVVVACIIDGNQSVLDNGHLEPCKPLKPLRIMPV